MVLAIRLAEFVNGNCKFLPEKFYASKHARIQEIHLSKNVKSIVLKRGTAHAQPMFGLKKRSGLGHFAGRILDRLRFIQNNIVEWNFNQELDIASQRAVGRYDDIITR